MSLERKIESSIFLCIPRDLNILGKSCTTFVIVKIVRNLSRGRSPCQKVNHVKSGVIYFFAFIFSYDTIHVSGTIHTWNRDLTDRPGRYRAQLRDGGGGESIQSFCCHFEHLRCVGKRCSGCSLSHSSSRLPHRSSSAFCRTGFRH